MSFMRHNRAPPQIEEDDSIVVSDSGEDDSFEAFQTPMKSRVIRDSDVESEDVPETSNQDEGDDSYSMDSEEEDVNFMNNSHRVSIIQHSSESESDAKEELARINKLKRRSIYENPSAAHTPNNKSTPINRHLRKKARANIISSDSESENVTTQSKKLAAEKSQSIYSDSDESMSNKSPYKKLQNVHEDEPVIDSDKNSDSVGEEYISKEKQSDFNITNGSDAQTQSQTNKINIENNSKDIIYDNKISIPTVNKVIDLTINESMHNLSRKEENTNFKKEKKSDLASNNIRKDKQKVNDSEIIISSASSASISSSSSASISGATSTSGSEIDNDVIQLAKKEIGVGNINPIEAQKREYLTLSIESTVKQLDKLNKFATSVNIEKLPDKGAKVYETIRQQEEKIMKLKADLAKLSNKTIFDSQERFQTPKVKPIKSLISPLTEDEDVKRHDLKETGTHNAKKKHNKSDESKLTNQFDEFDVHDIPTIPQTSFDAAELGKKALATLNKQQTLTHHRLEQLHGSLTSRPTENQKEKDPPGLKVPLMGHQQHALAWMKWREKQKPRGGILADDMGLGKTLTMISLVLATVNDERQNDSSNDSSSDDGWLSRKKHKRYYGGTLVICPASLIKQWEAEVKNRCNRGLLSVLVFHGNNRSLEDRKLSKFNIVVTTYQIIVREADAQTGMYRMEWDRIILDEAHYIRNHKSKACLAVCGLSAKRRWALTGTPIQNKEMDLYAILKFLKCSPFDDIQVWKRWVDNKNDAGKQRLITIMKTLMLRRTKQELQSKGSLESLPDKSLEVIEIEMDRDETLAYQKILLFSQNLFASFLAQRAEKNHMKELYGGKFDKPSYSSLGAKTQFTKAQKALLDHHSSVEAHEILVLLLRLRQMCCHPALIHSMLDKQESEMNGIDDIEETNADLLNKLHNMSINEEEGIEDHVASYKIDERVAANLLTKKNPVFNMDRCGSKVRSILSTIEEIIDKGDKLIVVSQWTSFLNVVAKHLDDIEDANYARFTGEVAVKKRQDILDKFNDPHDDTNILLLSLTAGGVGLNLVGANHLLLIDIHWNPQLEAQAQDRIYRFGQKKDVYVYKFICKDTIEERVKNLQDKKLDIANHVLTGTRSVSSKLTIDDLKLLFS